MRPLRDLRPVTVCIPAAVLAGHGGSLAPPEAAAPAAVSGDDSRAGIGTSRAGIKVAPPGGGAARLPSSVEIVRADDADLNRLFEEMHDLLPAFFRIINGDF
ncbi:MAG: hypothetical protein ACP5VC_17280, partial [Bryobacteraceae bacterium]